MAKKYNNSIEVKSQNCSNQSGINQEQKKPETPLSIHFLKQLNSTKIPLIHSKTLQSLNLNTFRTFKNSQTPT